MDDKRMLEIISEEIEKFDINESEFDTLSKKAEVLKAVSDFVKSLDKFEDSMTIQMRNSFSGVLEPLRQLLIDVGSNPESFLDVEKTRKSVVLKKSSDDEKGLNETMKVRIFESLKDAIRDKEQNK